MQSLNLLYYYLNRKPRLHVNSEDLEISTLIREKEKMNNYSSLILYFFCQKYPYTYLMNSYFL
jgi:hypothetical protein